MLNTNFSPWPDYTDEEAKAVSRVILSNKVNYWTGVESREFEKEFAGWTQARFAVALANGTLALDLALHALGIGPGDEVIVTPRTFLASVSSIILCGATPIFADVEIESQNISAVTILPKITSKTKAIIAVHLAGLPCEMDEIMDLAREHSLYVIEDCAQAHGAVYKGRPVGSIGHIGAWSFCQDKIISTGGEGGMVTTQDEELWKKMWSYKDHGKSFEAVYQREHPPGFRWVHDSFGSNFRMMEVQAVIGRLQLKRMSAWNQKRNEYAKVLDSAACTLDLYRLIKPPSHIQHAYYKYYLFIKPELLKKDWSRERVIEEFNTRGVPCYSGSCSEVYLEKAFEGTSFRPKERLANAKLLGETSVMFLIHPTLTTEEISLSAKMIREVGVMAQKE